MEMSLPSLRSLPRPRSGKTGWPCTVEAPVFQSNRLDGSPWPRISIVTPSYNQGEFIEETIRSVLLQDYPNVEYIIVDGGSSDDTIELIKKYSPWVAYWVSEPDRGQSHAINKGFAKARGEVVAWLNSDDVLQEHSLMAIGRYFAENPACGLLAGRSEIRDISGTTIFWHVEDLPRSLGQLLEFPLGRYLAQPSVFFRRCVLDRVGALDERLHYAMDLDLWLRIAEHNQIEILPQTLSWIRMHEGAKTFRGNVQVYSEVETIIARYRYRVAGSKYRALVRATRRCKARACLKSGFNAPCSAGQMRAAILDAFNHDKTVVFTRDWLGMVLRLILPLKLRRLIFVRA
jgi:glycosyltransferase involved in cell wall biosynthesis